MNGYLIWFHIRVWPVIGGEIEYILDKSPICCKANTERHTTIFAPTSNYRITNYPNLMHVFGLWLEAAVPGEKPYRHGEKMGLERSNREGPSALWGDSAIWKSDLKVAAQYEGDYLHMCVEILALNTIKGYQDIINFIINYITNGENCNHSYSDQQLLFK